MKCIFSRTTITLLLIILFNYSNLLSEKKYDFSEWNGNMDVIGENSFDQFGEDLIHGDVNGDGINDIICSSPSADPSGRNSAGIVYIFYGETILDQETTISLESNNADVTIYGAVAGQKCGSSLACGTVNSDLFDDVVIGAPFASTNDLEQNGLVYIINGSNNLPSIIDLASTTGIDKINGSASNDFLGSDITVANLNSDNLDEVIISAPNADSDNTQNCGKVYILWSNESYSQNLDLASANNVTYFVGNHINENLGYKIACGNINNDSFCDLFIGAPGFDDDSLLNNGRLFLIKGRGFFPFGQVDITNETYVNATIEGTNQASVIGKAFTVDDFNNDGNGDLLLTDQSSQLDSNLIYLILGNNSLTGTILANSENSNSLISGEGLDNTFGQYLYSGDVNNDSIYDMIISSPEAETTNGNSSGIVHVIYGNSLINTAYDVNLGDSDEVYLGSTTQSLTGTSISLCDFNNDSKNDIWIGSPGSGNNNGEINSVYGGIPWLYNRNPNEEATDVDIDSPVSFSLADDNQINISSISVVIAGTEYNSNSNNFSYSGSEENYRITVAPEDFYGYNQIIDVSVNAEDDDGWQIPESNYRFFTREDTDPPFTDLWIPAPDAVGVAVDTNIEFHIYDLGDGVDLSSITVNIQGENYYSGHPNFSALGEANDYTIVINPPQNFSFGELVNVTIDATDLAEVPNAMTSFEYSFTCGQDNSAPSIILIEPAYNEEVSRVNPVIIEVRDDETELNLSSAELKLDDVSILASSQITNITNGYRFYYSALDNGIHSFGNHEIEFYIEDSSSNAVDTLSVFSVIPDNEAPFTQNHYPDKFSTENATNTSFMVEIFDFLSGVDINTVSIRLNSQEIMSSPFTTITDVADGYRILYSPDERFQGEVSVEIDAGDLDIPANNMPTEVYTFECTSDTEAPYIENVDPEVGEINVSPETNVQFRIKDDKTGVDISTLSVKVNNIVVTDNVTTALVTSGFDVLYIPSEIFDFNEWVEVEIACYDKALVPNLFTTDYSFRITPDLIPPELVNLSPEANETGVPISENIYFEITDNGLGVDINSLSMRVNGVQVNPDYEEINDTNNYAVTYEHQDFDYSEEVIVVVSVSDLAASPNSLINYNYMFQTVDDDNVEPFFTAFNPTPDAIEVPVETSISMEILDADSGIDETSIIFKINNETIESYQLTPIDSDEGTGFQLLYEPNKEFNYNETVHVQIYAMDSSSNNNSNSMNYSFTTLVDDDPPYLSFSYPESGGNGYANSLVYLNFNDDLSGVDKTSFNLKINDSFVTTYTDSLDGNTFEVWYETEDNYTSDIVEVEYYISDKVGNTLNESFEFNIIEDIYPPYFVQIGSFADNQDEIVNKLKIAILDKGVGINKESIQFEVNNQSVENYSLDEHIYDSNPDSLGYVLTYNVNENNYDGQKLKVSIYAEDENNPISLSGEAQLSFYIWRELNSDKVEIVPNILSLNNDGYNDECRIIIPSNKNAVCKIFTMEGKEIKDLDIMPYSYEDSPDLSKGVQDYQVAIWDGRNKDNKIVNAGIYFCQVEVNGKKHLNTITIAK